MSKRKKDNVASREPVIENRKARHDYNITDTLEVGIALQGSEVKAVRASLVSLAEGFIMARRDPCKLVLHQVNIGEYGPAGRMSHAAVRNRVLLAHRKEIEKLAIALETKGVSLVPLKMYFKDGRAKLLLGVGEGKGHQDKRNTIKEREARRDIDRAMSKRMKV
ncbi:MAG: SsrA-binding protein SmpB [Planctomycetota bacterium]